MKMTSFGNTHISANANYYPKNENNQRNENCGNNFSNAGALFVVSIARRINKRNWSQHFEYI